MFWGKFINAIGKSVNNHVYHNEVSGNLVAIDMGDGTNSMEGWHIEHNLFNGKPDAAVAAGLAIDASGAGFCYFHHNICDFMGAGAAILVRSTGSLAPTGWDIHDNYVAFAAAGVQGIRLLNNVVPGATNKGHTVRDNRIFAYPTFSLTNGIVTDGSEEENNIISGNKVEATVACNNASALSSVFRDNKWLSGGFSTTVQCEYYGNSGDINTFTTLLIERSGKITRYFGSVQPSSGTYFLGDEVVNTNPVKDGNGMVLTGWTRLTTGSTHTGNDWGIQYISVNSPAT